MKFIHNIFYEKHYAIALYFLLKESGEMKCKDVCEVLKITRPRFYKIVNKLIKYNLLEKLIENGKFNKLRVIGYNQGTESVQNGYTLGIKRVHNWKLNSGEYEQETPILSNYKKSEVQNGYTLGTKSIQKGNISRTKKKQTDPKIESFHKLFCQSLEEIPNTRIPVPRVLNKKRKQQVLTCIKEVSDDPTEWVKVFKFFAKEPFYNGRNARDWVANFDFITRPNKFLEVLEKVNVINPDSEKYYISSADLDAINAMNGFY